MNYKISLFLLSQIRKFSTSLQLNQQKNHYNSLGIGKTATQADVKSAYYKLSKVYHPDKNQGHTLEQREQHSQKFRDITEAYEVLGNVTTRKLYDKGFMGGISYADPPRQTPDDPLHKFYKSRESRTRPPPPSGQQPIYDFDEWSRRHYGESVRKAQELRQRRAFHDAYKKDKKEAQQQEIFVYGGFLFILMCMIFKELNDSDIVRSAIGKEPKHSMPVNNE